MSKARVAILMGSKSDLELMQPAADTLSKLGVPYTMRVLSAHRTPKLTCEFADGAREAGIEVLICAAGGAAHLAGVVSGHTTLPVIGVPLARTPLAGVDALYATVQMPTGMPVATVAVDGSVNAAILAAQILGVTDSKVADAVLKQRLSRRAKVVADDKSLANL